MTTTRNTTHSLHWIIAVLLSVFLGSVVVAWFFLARLNPNDYRALIESSLSNSFGLDIRLGDLSFGWKDGFGIKVDGVEISESKEEIPFIHVETFLIRLDPPNLFRLRLVLCELRLVRPSFLVIKHKGGAYNIPMGLPKSTSRKRGLAVLLSRITVEDGSFHFLDGDRPLPVDVKFANIDGRIEQSVPGHLHFELRYPNPGNVFHFTGDASLLRASPNFRAKVEMSRFDLGLVSNLFRGVGKGRGGLAGAATGSFEFTTSGVNSEELKNSIQGKGSFEIQDGAILNFNVVKSVLQRITVIPGLQELLLGGLPLPFQRVLQRNDTAFRWLRGDLTVTPRGQIEINSFALKHAHYSVEAKGKSDFQGALDIQARLLLHTEISTFLIERINELARLSDAGGQLIVPFVCRGNLSSPRIRPDLVSITQNVIVTQGSKLVEKGIETLSKLLGGKT